MPKLNPYIVLGLHETGRNPKNNNRYTNKEIKDAYNKASLTTHPDKNPDIDAPDAFRAVQNAYTLLKDPNTRAAFHEELEKNPDAYVDNEHLFFFAEEEKEEKIEEQDGNATAMVLRTSSGIDLSQLLVNAECSPEKIVGLAKENLDFAKAVLSNMGIFSRLKSQQQFELLFLIFSELSAKNQLHLMEEVWSKPSVKYMLDRLRSNRSDEYESGFTFACLNNKETAEELLKKHRELFEGLSSEHLLNLSHVFYTVIPILIEKYANQLRPSELAYIILAHKENRHQILALCKKFISDTQYEKLFIYVVLADQIKKEAITSFDEFPSLAQLPHADLMPANIQALGVEAFSSERLAVNLRTLGIEAFSLAGSLTDGNMFKSPFVLNALSDTETPANFLQRYSSDEDQRIMRTCIIISLCVLKISNLRALNDSSGNQRNKRPMESCFTNSPVIRALLKKLDLREFEPFLNAYDPTGLSDEARAEWIDFILNHTLPSKKNSLPFFLTLLAKNSYVAQNFLRENPEVLEKLLKNKKYIAQIETNTSLQKKLALLLVLTSQPLMTGNSTRPIVNDNSAHSVENSEEVKSARDSDEAKFAEESNPIHASLEPWYSNYSAFFKYIQLPNDSTQKKIGTSESIVEEFKTPELIQQPDNPEGIKPKITFEEYIKLVNLTGFFPELFLIQTNDPRVKHDILKKAATHCTNYKYWNSNIHSRFDDWMESSLTACSKVELGELFMLYEKEADIIFSNLDKFKPYNFLSLFVKWPEGLPYLLTQYFTGATLKKLQATLGTVKFNKQILSFRRDLGLPWHDYYPDLYDAKKSLEALKEDAPIAVVEEIIEKAQIAFEKIQAKYPHYPLANYFTFRQSPFVTSRLAAYQELERLLSRLKEQDAGTADTDETLEQLRDLLQKSGLDLETLGLTRFSLQKKHPLLFSALLTLIHDSPDFELHNTLRTNIQKQSDTLHDMQSLAMQFSIIANRYIEKNQDTIPGDVLSALVRAHGEKALPTIEKYQLSDKVTNSTELHKAFAQIQEGASTLENKAITDEQIVHALIQKFQTLVDSISNQEALSPEAIHAFYAELQTTTQKNKIVHPDLTAFIENYPMQDKGNILAWIVRLAFQQHTFGKDTLIQWYQNEALKRQILKELFKAQKDITFSEIETLWGKDNVLRIVHDAVDTLPESLSSAAFCKDIVSHAQEQSAADEKNDNLNPVMPLENTYGTENRSKILAAYLRHHNAVFKWPNSEEQVKRSTICRLLAKGRITLDTVCKLKRDELKKLHTLRRYLRNTADDEITKDSSIFRLSPEVLPLLPLLEQNVLSEEKCAQLEPDSVAYLTYKKIVEKSSWKEPESVVEKLKLARDFFSTDYFQFIQTNILDPLQNEVDRLRGEEGGNKKSKAMKEERDRLVRCIIHVFRCKRKPSDDINSVKRTLHSYLTNLVRAISEKPAIDEHRKPVRAFFKGLLGVLLALPLLLIPLASEKFRGTFFNTQSSLALKKINKSIQKAPTEDLSNPYIHASPSS